MLNPKEEELKARIDAEMDHLYELALKVQIMEALITDMESTHKVHCSDCPPDCGCRPPVTARIVDGPQPAFSDYQLKEHLFGSDNTQG